MNIPNTNALRLAARAYGASRTHRSNGHLQVVQSGVGLIEVLVAVLVLSIAFLGIAALQAMSLSTNNSAMARSMATIDSYSILDAMRADIANAKAGNYNGTVTAATSAVPASGATAAVPANPAACPAAGTTSLAAVQLSQWCGQLSTDLGATTHTTGTVNCDNTGNCTVTIQFDDSRAGVGGGSSQQVITKAIL
ncbi:MAG TPA: type IV pilus modification protein PilV [Rhodanobacter sp.]|jgi:type IV pilus assembly protein PilV|nr:type IV pilus modification protein PilV [Rhodanobacter sp.]